MSSVRRLSEMAQELEKLAAVDIKSVTREKAQEYLNLIHPKWQTDEEKIAKEQASQLYDKYMTLRSAALIAWGPLETEWDAYKDEHAWLNEVLAAMQSDEEFRRYQSLEFFDASSGTSLYGLVQKHMAHRWSDEAYKGKLNNLLEKFPEAILKEYELLSVCAQFWNGAPVVFPANIDKLKELAKNVQLPVLFRLQMDILLRMGTLKDHNSEEAATVKQEQLLCRALLRGPQGNTFEKMIERIRAANLELYLNYVQIAHYERESMKSVEKDLYVPLIEKIWKTEPTEQDLQSHPKIFLLMTNEIMFQLVQQAYPNFMAPTNGTFPKC